MIIENCGSCENCENMEHLVENEIVEEEEDDDESADLEVAAVEAINNDISRSMLHHRKSSLALTPEEEPLDINRGPNETKYGLISPTPKHHLKLLLVFAHPDPVCDSLSKAADKLGFEITTSNTNIGALDEYQAKSHDLVIVDTRAKNFDNDLLCRSIRNTKGSQHTVIIAIVRKSAFERDDVTIASLLESGFNRCLIETTNVLVCVNELIVLKHCDLRTMAQHATCQAMYTALDKCRDLVIVTDDSYKFQYMNAACERQLGLRQEDTIGKTLQEQLVYDTVQINTMGSSLLRAREWSGPMTLKRKSTQETIVSNCRAVPFSCAGRMPTHFILVFDTNSIDPSNLSQSRGSIHSIRRGSTDVRSIGSDYLRRTSLAKLNALPLEAPITKIVGLIDQIRENVGSNGQLVQLIDKVEDILKGSELYVSHVKEDFRMKTDEPVVSDLITALLSKAPQPTVTASSRRSSNDSSVFRPSRTGLIKVPAAIRDLLDTALMWEFDIFKLEDLTRKRPLQHLGMNLFNHFDVCGALNCDERTLSNWLTVIEANYHAENSYHNSTHAADVMQATAGFLEKERMKSIMEPLDEATSLIAAAAHDLDHPGKSSAFLTNSNNPLAILYNDVTVLESHHAAMTFKLTLGDERVNIFKNLDRDTYKLARHNVIDMILATEMTKHFEHLAKFVNVFCTRSSVGSEIGDQSEDYAPILTAENTTLVKRMMIKCSDVSNPTRPLRLCVEWARRIAEEYFQQTDDEKARGLPVVMPMFDRQCCSIPKSQIGFVDYIINDMFEAWNAFIDMPELLTYMRQNYIRWKEFDEQNHTTLNDIQKLQATILAPSITSSIKSD
ncbi:high affinity cAMP-specific and IBMX-insensitive 3',5'-cyclic phosphodiesterase 8 isoform X3 [Dendroctonus ponderosae]|uniref:3',5'-cyclic-AMP phosphodiesterase n=1 Tax=Dendroctonus ponderosae TaxID=77166 RepID=A0AAR5QDJ3_DENPD|nr:high affinity cAMP-specific and IBMX-insensitive 3',5'-cyclic phosphodiesterase 8 isoform X3 [Dendroctonus ponderosae]XP_019771259.1 high affinity cAMP-specific and IBMX-insensitive 3',5'-cyclic phosphodiesterase 8 isoform X3 [Dendroctonus ponderosae]XP_019771260.1 high affinity cAMP-specific and IBMX-insensitive 3',5'-cyclic phosphodiesterase 8 isoform X3 [Dendroctonus ponderosae]XP_019771261.1 high affinity cAMP-specific and IBMX-insensitive 3',5'-cyclic phosphodiesterase 8 isoform X3 [Dend